MQATNYHRLNYQIDRETGLPVCGYCNKPTNSFKVRAGKPCCYLCYEREAIKGIEDIIKSLRREPYHCIARSVYRYLDNQGPIR